MYEKITLKGERLAVRLLKIDNFFTFHVDIYLSRHQII